jgi:hypothetical protein
MATFDIPSELRSMWHLTYVNYLLDRNTTVFLARRMVWKGDSFVLVLKKLEFVRWTSGYKEGLNTRVSKLSSCQDTRTWDVTQNEYAECWSHPDKALSEDKYTRTYVMKQCHLQNSCCPSVNKKHSRPDPKLRAASENIEAYPCSSDLGDFFQV